MGKAGAIGRKAVILQSRGQWIEARAKWLEFMRLVPPAARLFAQKQVDKIEENIMPLSKDKMYKFLEWLADQPEQLAQFASIIQEWLELQDEAPDVTTTEGGPRKFVIGGTVGVEIEGLSHSDLDAIKKNYAEAVVKEKAVEFVKGFITGVMFLR